MKTFDYHKKYTFESVLDMVDYCETADYKRLCSRETGRPGLYGTETWDEAVSLAKHGWTEGAEIVLAESEKLKSKLESRLPKQSLSYGVSGCMVDIGRYCEGVPECMLEFSQEETGGKKSITIEVMSAYPWYMEKEDILNHGAMILAFIDCLESVGYRVNLITVFSSQSKKGDYWFENVVTLKNESAPIDLPSFAFALMHPSYSRRFSIAVMETLPKYFHGPMSIGGEYGGVINKSSNESDIKISILDSETKSLSETEEKRVAWILENLKTLGVEIRENE